MKIALAAGHGANDPGAVRGSLVERDLMTQLRDITAVKLRDQGHTVRTDGERGSNWPLAKALTLIPGSDVAVELHMNAFGNPAARGVEVVARPSEKAWAQRIARGISDVLGSPLRGTGGWIDQSATARGKLAWVRGGGMLVEVCFISNQQDMDAYLERYWLVASALAEAISA
jgi:N-acetylmuramoyl-L-alanine amidase